MRSCTLNSKSNVTHRILFSSCSYHQLLSLISFSLIFSIWVLPFLPFLLRPPSSFDCLHLFVFLTSDNRWTCRPIYLSQERMRGLLAGQSNIKGPRISWMIQCQVFFILEWRRWLTKELFTRGVVIIDQWTSACEVFTTAYIFVHGWRNLCPSSMITIRNTCSHVKT